MANDRSIKFDNLDIFTLHPSRTSHVVWSMTPVVQPGSLDVEAVEEAGMAHDTLQLKRI